MNSKSNIRFELQRLKKISETCSVVISETCSVETDTDKGLLR